VNSHSRNTKGERDYKETLRPSFHLHLRGGRVMRNSLEAFTTGDNGAPNDTPRISMDLGMQMAAPVEGLTWAIAVVAGK
jgi:hypothetical protein